ncbi:hypothetical protein C7S18_02850 [Ahniella affigens]|uniref:Protein kinase domain-containing protein n=1 Tax=Ahniella affigens TaxID=2021234 RepID=A0A2P1PMY1_9GAMM|nr:serine/threonine-protein kinase [Ahniella affigens]AVP96195.1 hypothetical protein C7S18_02850 [Ahniella affigens]
MDADRWKQLRKLLDQALDLESEQRAQFANAVADESLRADLQRMLARHDHTTPLDRPAAVLAAEVIVERAPRDWDREQIGRRVGAFVLDDLIGSGGMGTVYRAHRVDGRLNQMVAIKLVLSAHPGLRDRFRKEQEIVAGLRHPNIAQLIDAGESEDGIPYLAMEYVEGVSITEFCRQRLPDAGSRIRLMLRVASALSHAHRNLVIHRDIKPSNILVTEDGLPILLDFGIAKLVGEDRFRPVTAQRLGPMTPAYAAPEQFRGGMISVATDVYQFGALLYRVLTGQLPYAADPHDAINWGRAVLESDPITLSRAITQARLEENTDASREAVKTLSRDINRDLDAILRTALSKEPSRRYPSIDAMVADLEAFLDGRPVVARHGDRWYHLTRFLRRHWLSTAIGSLSALGLITLTALSWQFAVKAQREAERATLAVDFLNQVMDAIDPIDGLGHRSSAEDVLKHALSRFQGEMADHPDLRAPLVIKLAITFANIGQPDEAYPLFQSALDEFLKTEADPLQKAEALERGAFSAYRSGHGEQAKLWTDEAELLVKGDSAKAYWIRDGIAFNRWIVVRDSGDNAEGLAMADVALQAARDAPEAVRDRIVQRALQRTGVSAATSGNLIRAEADLRESLGLARRLYGEDRYMTLRARSALAWFMTIKGEPARALVEFNTVCPRLKELLGPMAFDYGSCVYNTGNALMATKQNQKAIDAYREVASIYAGNTSNAAVQVGWALQNVALLQHADGHYEAARTTWNEVEKSWSQQLPSGAPVLTEYRFNRAKTELALHDWDAADRLLTRMLLDEPYLIGHPTENAYALYMVGQIAEQKDDRIRAELAYEDALAVIAKDPATLEAAWLPADLADLRARRQQLQQPESGR